MTAMMAVCGVAATLMMLVGSIFIIMFVVGREPSQLTFVFLFRSNKSERTRTIDHSYELSSSCTAVSYQHYRLNFRCSLFADRRITTNHAFYVANLRVV